MILTSASPLTWGLSLGVAVAYAASALGTATSDKSWQRLLVWLAWILHGVLLTVGLWGGEPKFGFAPALSVTAWLVGLVYVIEIYFFPALRMPMLLSGFGAAAVLTALLFPGNPLHAKASAWLPLHWALGIASYGLFAVAVVHAGLMGRAETRMRQAVNNQPGLPLLTMERLTFRFVSVGFTLLSATLIAGFFFGEQLYGPAHPVQFNHKTIFSVLSWLTFAVLMVGRWRFGWRGRQAVRVLYVGTGLLLLAYVGSRFVMEVVLERAV
jgi:ABC-type uncharacterized transport system permease subunit